MTRQTAPATRKVPRSGSLPSFVRHASFARTSAARQYEPAGLIAAPVDYDDRYMPDEITRDHARRMHYAAFRLHRSAAPTERRRWQRAYIALRDRIVLGNRKLIYRAVRRRMAVANRADDLIGDCHVVLIQAVAAYNPWLGIRFSTFAFTCLMRALSRLSQRRAADRLARWVPLEALPDGGPRDPDSEEPPGARAVRVDEFLGETS